MRSLLISICATSLVLAQTLVPAAAGAQSSPIAFSRGTTTGSKICSAAIGTSYWTTKADYVGLHNSNAVSDLLAGEAQAQSTLRMNPGQRLDKQTYPTPPNFCLKIFGTTLGQQWNNECN